MLCMTDVLRQKGAVIGRIGGNFTLPRPVRIRNLIIGGIGFVVGTLVVLVLTRSPINAVVFGGVLGATGAIVLFNFSPVEGESMFSFARLTLVHRHGSIVRAGERGHLCVGIAYVDDPARGRVRIRPGAVRIVPVQYDERGVLISRANRNLDRAADPALELVLGLRTVGGRPLPGDPARPPARRR